MISKIKNFVVNTVAAVNIVCIVLMLLVGYSDYIPPEKFPTLCWVGITFPGFVVLNLLFIPIWVFIRWRRLWLPVVGLLLAIGPIRTYLPLHGHQEVPEGSLRIISYNVAGYGGNYKYEHAFDSIFTFLKSQKPDIVCLQEDNSIKVKNIQQRYAEYFAYQDTFNVSNKKGIKTCLGIYSRFPILRKEEIFYDSPTNGSVAYYLQVGKDTVVVINNHLESSHLTSGDRTRYVEMLKGGMEKDTVEAESKLLLSKLAEAKVIRARHVDVIHDYIEAHRQYPVICCGDFNDTPISYTHRVMSRGLTDCFVESGKGLGLSFNRKGFNFRIDHLMCSSHFIPYECEINNKIDYSDHYPLLCWLKMEENP